MIQHTSQEPSSGPNRDLQLKVTHRQDNGPIFSDSSQFRLSKDIQVDSASHWAIFVKPQPLRGRVFIPPASGE